MGKKPTYGFPGNFMGTKPMVFPEISWEQTYENLFEPNPWAFPWIFPRETHPLLDKNSPRGTTPGARGGAGGPAGGLR